MADDSAVTCATGERQTLHAPSRPECAVAPSVPSSHTQRRLTPRPAPRAPDRGSRAPQVMSKLAAEHGSTNLGQGFPDDEGPAAMKDVACKALYEQSNQ